MIPATLAHAAGAVTLTLPPDHDVVEIKGMAMAPDLRAGMLVLVDRRHRSPSPPGMYMVDTGIGEQPMYVESLAGKKRVVRMWVADPHCQHFELGPADVKLRGRIVCIFKPT